ncbi:MAG: hypothetical protein HGA19_06065 [Oscillochloris sp.]|nr:hypothetical protein [Oscillochloris sp.]
MSSYLLASAFGWTPQQVQSLTMAQVSLYLQLLEHEMGFKQAALLPHV